MHRKRPSGAEARFFGGPKRHEWNSCPSRIRFAPHFQQTMDQLYLRERACAFCKMAICPA
jgi:hypothetical protein